MRGRLLRHLVDLLAGERLGQHARGHVGAERHAENFIAAVRGGDGLRHGGHAHGVRTEHARGAHLGRRFKLRAGEVHVDALAQREVLLPGDLFRELAQAGRVNARHIGEARAELVDIRPPERAEVEELDMVGDEHQIARGILGVHRARGVRHDHRLRAKQADNAAGVGGVLHRVALVAVHAALHDRHALAAQLAENEAALVSRRGGRAEVRDVRIAYAGARLDAVAEKAQAAAEHQQYLGTEIAEVRRDHIRALAVIIIGAVRLDRVGGKEITLIHRYSPCSA